MTTAMATTPKHPPGPPMDLANHARIPVPLGSRFDQRRRRLKPIS